MTQTYRNAAGKTVSHLSFSLFVSSQALVASAGSTLGVGALFCLSSLGEQSALDLFSPGLFAQSYFCLLPFLQSWVKLVLSRVKVGSLCAFLLAESR